MTPIKTLLPELRQVVVELAEDLLGRSTENAQIDAGLREAYGQIEKGGRTAQAFEVWRDDYLDQVAVAWVLACIFVRFMEDNALLNECWLAGEGERRKLAEDSHELFFRAHPHDTDREYFQHVFKEVGQIPAAKDLFAEGKTPLWAIAPSGDMAMSLLKFWREMDAESGHLKRSFDVEPGDTRFLGDLYQELSEKAQKKYALLQTPIFVEEFILDRTLTPALAEFGLERVRMIDPTCGSGHFLLGGFARLFREWSKQESNEIKAAQKALDGVWGVDINPFIVKFQPGDGQRVGRLPIWRKLVEHGLPRLFIGLLPRHALLLQFLADLVTELGRFMPAPLIAQAFSCGDFALIHKDPLLDLGREKIADFSESGMSALGNPRSPGGLAQNPPGIGAPPGLSLSFRQLLDDGGEVGDGIQHLPAEMNGRQRPPRGAHCP
jgi:hypothetical protein